MQVQSWPGSNFIESWSETPNPRPQAAAAVLAPAAAWASRTAKSLSGPGRTLKFTASRIECSGSAH